MKLRTRDLIKDIKELFDKKKYNDVIETLVDRVLIARNNVELYVWRGNAWYNMKEYEKAITDYDEGLKLDSKYALAYYNRGTVKRILDDSEGAIEDYEKAINLEPNYIGDYYIALGNAYKFKGDLDKALESYEKAIDKEPYLENAHYKSGLVRYELKNDIDGSKRDFERYLELSIERNDFWSIYANNYIERIKDKKLSEIVDLIDRFKKELLMDEGLITHYTNLRVLKKLILDNEKFRISEGNFMNDPSEGVEFFKFIEYAKLEYEKEDGNLQKHFPKPFIGSFVNNKKNNDLSMWRFYGKEMGVEAKGCSIILRMKDFVDDINILLFGETQKALIDRESDINFYHVAYFISEKNSFDVPNFPQKGKKLKTLMIDIKKKVSEYGKRTKSLDGYLNSIAFLVKSGCYKSEEEVRLVVKGIEFEKKYDMDVTPPRVYIELESIKNSVEQITLGPKTDNSSEWASAIYNSYKGKTPDILISRLPYK